MTSYASKQRNHHQEQQQQQQQLPAATAGHVTPAWSTNDAYYNDATMQAPNQTRRWLTFENS